MRLLAQRTIAGFLDGFVAETGFFVFFVLRVVAFEEVNIAIALESEDVRTDTVEEPTVVAHNNGATGKVFQTFFQSTQGVHVDIVEH